MPRTIKHLNTGRQPEARLSRVEVELAGLRAVDGRKLEARIARVEDQLALLRAVVDAAIPARSRNLRPADGAKRTPAAKKKRRVASSHNAPAPIDAVRTLERAA